MKKRKLILVINLIVIIALIVTLILVNQSKGNDVSNNDNQNAGGDTIQNENAEIEDDKYTEVVNGVKRNNSEKLHETKTLGNITVENVNLMYKENKTTMVLVIKNNASEEVGDYDAKVTLKNSKGQIIEELDVYINHIEAGKTASIVASITRDVTGAYDYEISR